MLIVDTREKKWDHIRDYLEREHIDFRVQKLDFGDYMVEGSNVTIDRKQNLDEVAANLCTRDSSRFWREIRNAKKHGLRVIILVEHGPNVRNSSDVRAWVSKYHHITGNRLVQEMFNCSVAYGVQWEFCSKKETGKRILELLGGVNGNTDGVAENL